VCWRFDFLLLLQNALPSAAKNVLPVCGKWMPKLLVRARPRRLTSPPPQTCAACSCDSRERERERELIGSRSLALSLPPSTPNLTTHRKGRSEGTLQYTDVYWASAMCCFSSSPQTQLRHQDIRARTRSPPFPYSGVDTCLVWYVWFKVSALAYPAVPAPSRPRFLPSHSTELNYVSYFHALARHSVARSRALLLLESVPDVHWYRSM
jgi:hypothetical protein